MQDPESIVKAFIADYYRWNERANARHARNKSQSSMAEADADYAHLLMQFCRPDVKRLLIAFGSPSSHDPSTEIVREVTINDHAAVVRTTNQDSFGHAADYEYFLSLENGRWFIDALDYVNDEGRYPCL